MKRTCQCPRLARLIWRYPDNGSWRQGGRCRPATGACGRWDRAGAFSVGGILMHWSALPIRRVGVLLTGIAVVAVALCPGEGPGAGQRTGRPPDRKGTALAAAT